jgi:two-component system, OmpR family, copper resistance phosphate regulon response regulator CusR
MKLLILKDQPSANDFLKSELEEQSYSVNVIPYELTSNLELEEGVELIILDLKHPELNAIHACKAIREKYKFIPIIILSQSENIKNKVDVLDAGADDYLVAPFEFIELSARIRALIRRNNSYQQAKLYSVSDLELDAETKMVTRNGININLTTKEFDLLEYFFKNPGKVVTRRELAEKVWDTSFDGATNKIEVYINYLRKKIDKGFQGKLIHTVVGKGYLFKLNEVKNKN